MFLEVKQNEIINLDNVIRVTKDDVNNSLFLLTIGRDINNKMHDGNKQLKYIYKTNEELNNIYNKILNEISHK